MNVIALDKDLRALVEKRTQLSKIDYNNENYDDLEEELHDMEDDFHDAYGSYLDEAFHEVHDEYCPDSDVLMPIAYVPKKVNIQKGDMYDVDFTQGVYVDVDDYPGNDTKLVLLPSPTRIVLQVSSSQRETVWKAE